MGSAEKAVAASAWNKVERFMIFLRRGHAGLRGHFRFGRFRSREYKPRGVCPGKKLEALVKLGISVKLVWLFLFVLQSPEWPYRRTYGFNGNARGRTAGGLKHPPLQLQMR